MRVWGTLGPTASGMMPAQADVRCANAGSAVGPSASLPSAPAAALARVGVLGPSGASARRRAEWQRQVLTWRRELGARGYAVLHGLFTPLFLDAMRRYYRRLEAEGYLLVGEPRRAGHPLLYDEPLLRFLAGQLVPVVGRVTGEPTSPSFVSYLRVYDPGAVLARHRDRWTCRWNIDLVVGGDPAPDHRAAWPLWIDGRRGPAPVRLALGDGLLYRGTDVWHWRRPQPAGRTTAVASFHYGNGPQRQ
jgi:hypothetical protein